MNFSTLGKTESSQSYVQDVLVHSHMNRSLHDSGRFYSKQFQKEYTTNKSEREREKIYRFGFRTYPTVTSE